MWPLDRVITCPRGVRRQEDRMNRSFVSAVAAGLFAVVATMGLAWCGYCSADTFAVARGL